jgi:hypothetical protein
MSRNFRSYHVCFVKLGFDVFPFKTLYTALSSLFNWVSDVGYHFVWWASKWLSPYSCEHDILGHQDQAPWRWTQWVSSYKLSWLFCSRLCKPSDMCIVSCSLIPSCQEIFGFVGYFFITTMGYQDFFKICLLLLINLQAYWFRFR